MTSKFARETISELFGLVFVNFIAILLIIGGAIIHSSPIGAFGLGLTVSITIYRGAGFIIYRVCEKYNPDPME